MKRGMKSGTKVRVKAGSSFVGCIGVIESIIKGPATGKLIADVRFTRANVLMGFYLNQIEEIDTPPIKLKKFSAWK